MAKQPKTEKAEPEKPEKAEKAEETPPSAEITKVSSDGTLKPSIPTGARTKVVRPVDEKLISVRPRIDIPRCSIGGSWYSFRKGITVSVPENVAKILESRGHI